MGERFNDVETDFDLEYLKFGLITILLSGIQNENRKRRKQEWGVRRCRIWIFQLNLYWTCSLFLPHCEMWTQTVFFFEGDGRSSISQKQMVTLSAFNEKIMLEFVLILFTWSHTDWIKQNKLRTELLFSVLFLNFLWDFHSFRELITLVCCCSLFCPGFALESLSSSLIYLHSDKTILNNNLCMCVCVWAQNTIVLWWLWWRIRPPERCFLHQINLNYNQFRWWLWFEEAAVATATVALFGFPEFLRSLFLSSFGFVSVLSYFVWPCFWLVYSTIFNPRKEMFQMFSFIPLDCWQCMCIPFRTHFALTTLHSNFNFWQSNNNRINIAKTLFCFRARAHMYRKKFNFDKSDSFTGKYLK